MRTFQWANMMPIGMCLFGAMLSSLGMVVQKVAHKEAASSPHQPYFLQPKWFLGFIVYCCGDFTLFLALWYLPQAVVAVLGTWTLVANFGFAACLLGEKLHFTNISATALIIVGTTLALSAYKSGSDAYTTAQLLRFLGKRPFQMFVAFIVVLLAGDLVWLAIDAQPRSILVRVAKYGVKRRKQSRSFSYIFAASIVNTLVMLLGKCVAAMSKLAVHSGTTLYALVTTGGGAFMLIFVTCGLVCILNVHLVNKALYYGDALFVVPLYFVLGLCFKVTSGLLFFQDYLYMSQLDILVFILGCFVNIAGVYVLAVNREIEDNRGGIIVQAHSRSYSSGSVGGGDDDANQRRAFLNSKTDRRARVRDVENAGEEGHGERVSSISLFGFNIL